MRGCLWERTGQCARHRLRRTAGTRHGAQRQRYCRHRYRLWSGRQGWQHADGQRQRHCRDIIV